MPDNIKKVDVWLIGVGLMGIEYTKVLQAQHRIFVSIGRGSASADAYFSVTGIQPVTNGIERAVSSGLDIPQNAIIAVNVEQLGQVCMSVIRLGIKRILVEKPAGLDYRQISELNLLAQKYGAEVFVAYNRRFYASVLKAQELIEADGGVTSFAFDFTEWSHKIERLSKPKEVFENWLLANSSHVIDLAFYLGGKPQKISAFVTGGTSWYKKASIFSGAGVSENGALFSYRANWESAGRWRVEMQTKRHTFILCPLETLQIQERGRVDVSTVPLEDGRDRDFKPGLYLQTEMFFNGGNHGLLSLEEHCKNVRIYEIIEQGDNASTIDS